MPVRPARGRAPRPARAHRPRHALPVQGRRPVLVGARGVEIRANGDVIARSERPVVVFETGVPLRFYLPREDVDAALRTSETTSVCPYKGTASYWSLDGVEDAAWSYEEPLEAMTKARGNLCFDAEKVEVLEV